MRAQSLSSLENWQEDLSHDFTHCQEWVISSQFTRHFMHLIPWTQTGHTILVLFTSLGDEDILSELHDKTDAAARSRTWGISGFHGLQIVYKKTKIHRKTDGTNQWEGKQFQTIHKYDHTDIHKRILFVFQTFYVWDKKLILLQNI